MTTKELAREAYASIQTGDDASYDSLNKSKRYELEEIANRGGDSSPFGQSVAQIIAEAPESVTTDVVIDESKSSNQREPSYSRDELLKIGKSRKKGEGKAALVALAVASGAEVVPDNQTIEEIADAIIEKQSE